MTDHIGDKHEINHLVTPSPTPSRDVLAYSQTDGARQRIGSEDYFYPDQSPMPQQSGHNGYHHRNRSPAQVRSQAVQHLRISHILTLSSLTGGI